MSTSTKTYKSTSKLIKKIGITIVIPIFMLICGIIIILSSAWNLIAESYTLGSVLFAKPQVHLAEKTFQVNDVYIYRPNIGEQFGTIKINSLGIDKPVIHGDDNEELRKGIGHYAGSTIPGENGNVVLCGHRDTAFKALENIKKDDEVEFETSYGKFKYKVNDIKIVDPGSSLATEVTNHERLTLYTCYPFNFIGSAPNRFVVICDYIGKE